MIAWATYPYNGAVVLVTGGGTGIGEAVTRAFLEQGARVAVAGRTESALHAATHGFDEARVHHVTADLTDPDQLRDVVASTIDRFGRLDVVIASAGTSAASDIDTFDAAAWDEVRKINLDSVIALAGATVPHLRASRGTFIAVSSIAGMRGDWGMFAYNATKAAVNGFVQSLALDLGDDGVRVNAVAPAFTTTRLTRERLDEPVFMERLLDRVTLGRVAEPEDIARVVLFLAGPDAGYITGAVIPVDGGTTASSGTPRPLV